MHGGGLELALVFLLAAVIAVPVFKRVRLGGVLGYLAAGDCRTCPKQQACRKPVKFLHAPLESLPQRR